jgi:hypothetical protein
MYPDISLDSFDARRNFLRVLHQQGRVFLDADLNEQSAIVLRWLNRLAQDLYGPHGGGDPNGFKPSPSDDKKTVIISKGRYYVAGAPCENHSEQQEYARQKDFPDAKLPNPPYLVYLEVWERHLTAYEGSDPPLYDAKSLTSFSWELAMGPRDTTTRTRIVWQVKALPIDGNDALYMQVFKPETDTREEYKLFLNFLRAKGVKAREPGEVGLLAARINPAGDAGKGSDSCDSAAGSYRGESNQLFRVEVHEEGTGGITFTWASDNGSAVFPIREQVPEDPKGGTIRLSLQTLGRDPHNGLQRGQWVEFIDERYSLRAVGSEGPRRLLKVKDVDPDDAVVILSTKAEDGGPFQPYDKPLLGTNIENPLLRRWDAGIVPSVAGKWVDTTTWYPLRDGVEVQFTELDKLRRGDFWVIPARTSTRTLIWPADKQGNPIGMPPREVLHAYAPLLLVPAEGHYVDLRRIFDLDPGRVTKPKNKKAGG